MAIDTSMYGQIKPLQIDGPLDMAAKAAQFKQMQSQNRLADLMFGEKERAIQEEGATNRLWQSFVKPDGSVDRSGFIGALASNNLGSKIPTYQKTFAEQDKSDAETNKIKYEAVNKADEFRRNLLSNVNDPQAAMQWMQATYSDPVLGPIFSKMRPIEQALAAIPQDPAAFADWKRQSALGAAKFIEQNKPTIQTRNIGGTTETMAIDPFTGQVRVTNSVKNTMTPGEIAADARGREANALKAQEIKAVSLSQPFEVSGADGNPVLVQQDKRSGQLIPVQGFKPKESAGTSATEGERKAATLLKRLEGSQAQLNAALQENPDAAKPGILQNGLRAMGADALSNKVTGAERQRIEAAQIDMLDAALTLGTGAAYTKEQLEGYRKSYFPQLGDAPATIKDKEARLKNVIEAAKIAAGRAAPKAPASSPNIDDLLKKYGG